MKFRLSLAASLIYLLAATRAHSFEKTTPQGASCPIQSCGGKNDVMQNVKVTLSPKEPRLNSNLTVTFDATVTKPITKGSEIGARYYIDGHLKKPFPNTDFCNLILLETNLTCPIQPGPLHVPVTFSIGDISQGTYGVYANATDQDGVQMFCIYANCIVT